MTVKTIKLDGEYTTVTEYAKANNIKSRAAQLRIKKSNFPYEVVQISGTYLIKIK